MSEFKPLSDLVFNVTDKVAGKKDSAKPYVGLEHMPSGGSSLLGFGRASDSISTNNVFRPGDTLFGKLRPQLRKSVHVSFDGYCSTDILVLRASTGANAEFAAKIIQSEGVFAQAIRTEEGTKMPRTSWRAIKDVPVLSPPLPQQRKIARILTTVDNLIEKTEALIAKYQAIKQGMMHDLFTRGVDEHGHLRPPYEQAPELYKQSELGWIPKEWEAQKLGEALRIAGGYLQTGPFGSQLHSYEYVTEGIPVVMPQDITGGRIFTDQIARITKSKADSMARHRLRLNDVVFSRRGDLSRAAAISPIEDGWICGTGCFLLRCAPDRLDANWIARQYAMPHVQRQVDANAVGSTMPSLNNAVMERLLMLIPSPPEQAEIGRRIVALESVHENLRSELHKSSLTKTGLMQDLLTGKVRVNVDEAEEVVP